MPRLYVLSGDDLGQTFDVEESPAILGRIQGVDCVVRGASVSRRHARLEHDGEGWTLVDLESSNGIAKGGVRRPRIELEDGDVFLLGDIELRFRDERGPGRSTVSAPELAEGEEEERASMTHDLARPRGGAGIEIQTGGGAGAEDDGSEEEIELEGDWSDEPAPLPVAPPAASRPVVGAPAATPKKADDRSSRQAAARAAALGTGAKRGEQKTTSGRAILQYNRVEDRGGLMGSDLEQQPLAVRLMILALLLAFGAGLVYGAFRLTHSLRNPSADLSPTSES